MIDKKMKTNDAAHLRPVTIHLRLTVANENTLSRKIARFGTLTCPKG